MPLYTYCVVPAAHRVPALLTGIDNASVMALSSPQISAWVSHHELRPEPSLERIQAHDRVVQAAISPDVTPVPVRFGQWLAKAALEQHLSEQAARYCTCLEKVAGALEFGIRVLDSQRSARLLPRKLAASGRAYMSALREEYRGREQSESESNVLRDRIRQSLAALTRAEQFESAQDAHGMLSVVHLVEHAQHGSYRAAVHRLREQLPHLRFLVSGPWPPYSFVN
ncbi:MAG TPA: GvpL/GvpF family gas vesicle protein [Longimicrobiales bacterium]|nr:GvpL/GvpF family gas vesicle protein [Longimicrobiales bacterium]